jgi:3',5'-cyclic AMP phosphodiesterase CpdA
VAHLSDLHIVGERFGYRMEAGTRGPRGNGRVRRALRRLAAMDARAPLDRILVTGDITDAGTRAEWIEFLDLCRRAPTLRARLLFVPGNHDVNVIDRTNPGRFDLPWSAGHALRKLRVVLALDAVQGDVVHVVERSTGVPGRTLRSYLREGDRPELLRELADRATPRGRREIARIWEEIFPLVVPPSDTEAYGVILLDSNARRHFSLTNAIGVVGRSQLRALEALLRGSRDRPWMILLHHAVAEYPVPAIGLRDRIGLALVNAQDVLSAIASHGSPVVVLHGHRHWEWIGTRSEVVLCSAPSVELGSYNQDKTRGSFFVYELAPGSDGGMRLTSLERVPIE